MENKMSEAHGDEHLTIDLEPHLEGALEMVIECVMNFGVWPQPRKVGRFITSGSSRPTRFDLYDFLESKNVPEEAELREFFIASLNTTSSTWGAFSDMRSMWEKKITKLLTEHFTGSEIVKELAQKLAEEERT